jgi:hypothetical protein
MIGWILLAALTSPDVPQSENAPSNRTAETLKIDILLKPPAEKCDTQPGDEIVVCASKTDDESQRLRPIANAHIYDKDESRADFGLSENVRMAVEADSAEMGGGVVSKRIMARVKIKF